MAHDLVGHRPFELASCDLPLVTVNVGGYYGPSEALPRNDRAQPDFIATARLQ